MWYVLARLRLIALGLGVLAAGSIAEASVISFKAVKKNNVAITPTDNLAILGGDTIEVEMFLSEWSSDFPSPSRVRTVQVKLDRARYISPDNGTATPVGWCGPVDKIACTDSSTCPAAYPICLTSAPPPGGTGCTCSPHNPALGAAMNTSRSDFLFQTPQGLMDGFFDIDTSNIDFKYLGLASDDSVPDTGVPRYLGTLFLKVSANACGTFSIGFIQEVTATFIADPSNNPVLPSLQPLSLTVSDCSRQLLSCNPNHCNIDARIPHDRLNAGALRNTNQIVMTFSKTTAGMTAADLEVTLIPFEPNTNCTGPGVPYACCTGAGTGNCDVIPGIIAVTPGADPKIATVSFNKRIQQTRWTCIRDKGSNKRCCMGSLPADADDSRISRSDDIFEVLDNLKGIVVPPLPNEKCDTDRTLRCTGADLLMVGDLLNGADAFIEVDGDSLPLLQRNACPDMRLAP